MAVDPDQVQGERLFQGAIAGDRRVNANHRDPVMTSHPPSSQPGSVVDGRGIRHPDQMARCGCGHSGTKPFRDGPHLTVDFGGTPAR